MDLPLRPHGGGPGKRAMPLEAGRAIEACFASALLPSDGKTGLELATFRIGETG
jgi:hypothetical protein